MGGSIWGNAVETDWWWHIRTGEWILHHHQLPRTDPFSITGVGKPWVAYSWPFEVALYEIAIHWDLLGVVFAAVAMWMGMTLALFYFVRSFKPPFWTSVVLAGLGGYTFQRVTSPRPGPLTVIFFILVLEVLCTAQRTGSVRRLWLLPVILWIWANVHVQFLYGLFAIGVFCMLPAFDRVLSWVGLPREAETRYLPASWMWGTLAASTAATFLNPYGIGVYQVIWDFVHQPNLYRFIIETRAMSFELNVHFAVLLICLAGVFTLGRDRRIRPVWFVLMLWGALLSFHAERDLWLVTVISCGVIAQRIGEDHPENVPVQRRVWLAAIACILLLVTIRFKSGPTNKDLSSLVASRLPLGAVAYLHEHHLQGPIFNNFDWGGFLIYALPEMKVAIDGRTNIHGQAEVGRSLQTWNVVGDDWRQDPLLEKANLVIAPTDRSLTYALRLDPHFKAIFSDGTVVLYQRVSPDSAKQESASK